MIIGFTDREAMLRLSSLAAGLMFLASSLASVPAKDKPPQGSAPVVCRALADLGMDAKQSEDEFAEPPLVRVEGDLFVVGVNWNLKRFSTRSGSGGRRRYVLARLDPDNLQPLETTSGDAPYIRFGPSTIGLVGADDRLFLLAGGQLSLVNAGLKLEAMTGDLANTAGQVAVVTAGDLVAISGLIIKQQMRYPKLWVWNSHTHTMQFSHEFRLTQRAVALAIDLANKAVVLNSEDGVREMSYVDGTDRKIILGTGVDTWGFHCSPYVIIPRSGRYSPATGYAIFDPQNQKARYWTPGGGEAYAAGSCTGNSLVAVAYKFKLQRHDGLNALEDSRCIECQLAYAPNRLPHRAFGDGAQTADNKTVVRASVASYDLASGKGSQVTADLPLEVPLASAWEPDRQRLFVMTTGHICSVEMREPRLLDNE